MDRSAAHARARRIVQLVARGEATSRSELAEVLGIAPSTVGIAVQDLVDAGLLGETGSGPSRGGRRPRALAVPEQRGEVLSVDLGGGHARIGRLTLTGTLVDSVSFPVALVDGPEATLSAVVDACRGMSAGALHGVGVSLPGPVDTALGGVERPSRMPGWAGFPVGGYLADRLGVPVAVENDANLAALGEHRLRFGDGLHSITVKAGTAIGAGVVVDGRLHRGATSAAGDITHTCIETGAGVACACGNVDCLETVASGAGLVRQLREAGYEVTSTAEVLALALDADPLASRLVRQAGTYLGQVLSVVVNFFNPHAVFLTGSLSSSEPFIAAVRGRVYASCHPLVTQTLTIEAARSGADAILLGAANLVLDHHEVAPL